jgi:sec-independent protein translocase protein TatA
MLGDLVSPVHILLLLVVALLVFGPRRLPEIGSGLGRGIREFRRALSSVTNPEEGKDLPVQVEEPEKKL